jgi:hypothetical protein
MVAKVTSCEYFYSQPWGRFCYENPLIYGAIDGLYYPNSHNFGIAVALFDRATDAMPPRPLFDRKLWSSKHRSELLEAAFVTNTQVSP